MSAAAALAVAAVLAAVVLGQGVETSGSLRADTCVSEWGYGADNGPAHWGTICGGKYVYCGDSMDQSPINFPGAYDYAWPGYPQLSVGWSSFLDVAASFTGVTLEIALPTLSDLAGNASRLSLGGGRTTGGHLLKSVYIHVESEHTLRSKVYSGEVHFVHIKNGRDYAVVSVLLAVGKHATWLEPLTSVIEAGELAAKGDSTRLPYFNFAGALPADMSAATWYTYDGSLTTPPCVPIVQWYVLDEPREVSLRQAELLRGLLVNNRRPTIPLGRRVITRGPGDHALRPQDTSEEVVDTEEESTGLPIPHPDLPDSDAILSPASALMVPEIVVLFIVLVVILG